MASEKITKPKKLHEKMDMSIDGLLTINDNIKKLMDVLKQVQQNQIVLQHKIKAIRDAEEPKIIT